VWPARGLNNFISAASILRLCEAVKVQFSDPYKNVGKTKVLDKFKMVSVLTFLKIVLLIVPMSYIYMELLVKPEFLTLYIYEPTFGNAESHLYRNCRTVF
jgi:hypothetical protein